MSLNAWLRYDVISRHLRAIGPVGSVLEIGCGGGGLGARLAAASAYTGVELDDTSLDLARRRVAAAGGGRVLMGDERDVVPPDETFDLVCAFEVLEHIEDDQAALRTWSRRIRGGGHLMLSVPAGSDRFGPSDEMAGHYRRYDDRQLRAVLEQAGLEVVDLRRVGFPLGYLLETTRNLIARRHLVAGESLEARTAKSGRLLQPPESLGIAFAAASAPFRLMQRPFRRHGTSLVALARRPA
jgi:SAM-dependent methyltransferase